MKMRRSIWLVAGLFLACCASAASSKVLSGSIDFSTPGLWGKTVYFGLNDSGSSGGETHWYFDSVSDSSTIEQHAGTSSGYLSAFAAKGVHRTISALTSREGPAASEGQEIPSAGLYIDTQVTLASYTAESGMPTPNMDKDKLRVWTYGAQRTDLATLYVTAGRIAADGTITSTNICTDLAGMTSGTSVQLVLRAVTGVTFAEYAGTGVGFEVWVNGAQVTYDGGTKSVFPSLQQKWASAGTTAELIYSVGFSGPSEVDNIAFTRANPIDDPTYAEDDVTMLQECAQITVNGAGASGLTEFPMLVRVSEERVKGFYYARARSDGGDIRFTDERGKLVPHEIDTWHDANGESLIWVRVPYLRTGTTLTMHWNLATGSSLPANDATAVWKDYVAVWHMNATGGTVKDATGHGYTATPTGAELTSYTGAPIGAAVEMEYVDGKAQLVSDNLEDELGTDGTFTFTGLYFARSYPSTRYGSTSFALYGTKGTNAVSSAGWCGAYQKTTNHYYYADATKLSSSKLPRFDEQWYHTALSYDGKVATSYNNGVADAQAEATITTTDLPFKLMADGLCADEVRISKIARDAAWLSVESAQVSDASFATFASALPKGDVNYWIEEPSVTPNSWARDEAEDVVLSMGRARFGETTVEYRDAAGKASSAFPTEAGVYKAVFTAGDGALHAQISKTVNLVIYDKRAYRNVVGYDRVMLFNSDLTPGSEVTMQGFWDVDDKRQAVWEHSAEPWQGDGDFVQDGAFHIYHEPLTGAKLWEFRHARIGNLYPNDANELAAGLNLLPWNARYACRYDDSEMPAMRSRYAGTLLLQNVGGLEDPAGAYSPYYTNGIGTIYFDVVNAYGAWTNSVKLQSCATAPDAEDVTLGVWRDVPVTALTVINGQYDSAATVTNVTSVNLAMTAAEGSTNSFYRVRAVIDSTAPVRFRLVRDDANWSAAGVDGAGLVAVDNIIVSAPGMGVTIEQYGAPADPNDHEFFGQKAPFSIPFPSAADIGTLKSLVKVNYIVNGTNVADSSFVGSLIMRYRWRYLNQYVGAWKDVVMQASPDDPTKFISNDPLEGENEGEGDIEYSFTAVVNAPYYEYVDYSGLDLKWADFTERRGNVEINAEKDGVYGPENLSPALGTDYFVRIRESQSSYEGYKLRVRRAGVADTTVSMQLAADGTWRGFYLMATNYSGNVSWQIEADNYQPQAAGYNWSTNYYHTETDATSLPVNDVLVAGTSEQWSQVPSDAVTGYLMFQLEEGSRALTIIHADYQDFNGWTDANRDDGDVNGHFVGTSTADGEKSGVSRTVKTYVGDFSFFTESVSSNAYLWEEHFNVQASETGKYAIETPFSSMTTPNGWGAANGMWMPESYRQQTASIALQMQGEGQGSLTFAISTPPRGLQSFNYRARVAQSFDIYSYNYYRGTNEYYALKNYTFATPCVMRRDGAADFEGLGAVSVVAYYDDGKGCYEARVERVSSTEYRIALYKWSVSGRHISSQLLATSVNGKYADAGLDGNKACGALFISCDTYYDIDLGCDAVRVQGGVFMDTKIVRDDVANATLNGMKYLTAFYTDCSTDQHREGTFGVGSVNCPASFVAPQFYASPADWSTASSIHSVKFGSAKKQLLISNDDDYDQWTIRQGLLDAKTAEEQKSKPQGWGFNATAPSQNLILEIASRSSQDYEPLATNVVSSFGFVEMTNAVYLAETVDVRVRTGGVRGDGSCDVTVDDFRALQWRGEDYNDSDNPDYDHFPDVLRGSPTNMVYTTAWIDGQRGVELSPMRTTVTQPASLRAPLMDGVNGRGLGLGMLSFRYRNADRRARLVVQIATNGIDVTTLSDYTERFAGWTTVKTFDFSTVSDEDLEGGVLSCYLGIHGVKGAMRLVVDPALVAEAHDASVNPSNDPTFGRVTVVSFAVRDNPALDNGCWWGWNLRTTDDHAMQMLRDGSLEPAETGLAFALNNSISDDVRIEEKDSYPKHMPFLQTPVFTKGAVGQLSFKARKYASTDPDTTVAIYGTTSLGTVTDDDEFTYLGEVVVDSERYKTYTFSASLTKNFTGFRLAITGVSGVLKPGPLPQSGDVERVLIDEVAVFEAIKARVGFRKVGAFRTSLEREVPVANVPSKSEQPLCGESWGVQTEIYFAQLSDTIDQDRTPEVHLYWHSGKSPWGFNNWRDSANHALLARVGDETNYVYRSTYSTTDKSIIDSSTDKDGTVYQYALEVVYYMKGFDEPLTNTLSAVDWATPSWYAPIDYNASLGKGTSFAAYTILDSVAPDWAWINEINVFGLRENGDNNEKDFQYIEIAAPVEADLTGWKVRLLLPETGSDSIVTNTLATFGLSGLSGKKDSKFKTWSNMVFRVIANRATYTSGNLKYDDGTLDGIWDVQDARSGVDADGTISYYNGFGVQLVRPSGAVAHELVAIGTNIFETSQSRWQYHPTNVVNYLNRLMPKASFFYAGDDNGGQPNSLSVFDGHGEVSNVWSKVLVKTPGTINEGQYINPDHPTPNGSSIIIYANLATDHITQSVDNMIVVPKGSAVGTNIIYIVDRWYEMGDVTTNGVAVVPTPLVEPRSYMLNVGRGCSNNITLLAGAKVDHRLSEKYGLTEDNRYTPAVIDWLEKGVDAYGHDWPSDVDIDSLYLADVLNTFNEVVTNLTLTQMYWLDMCPLISNQCLVAGFSKPPQPIVRERVSDGKRLTNVVMTVYAMISNRTDDIYSPYYGAGWAKAPYVLRGVEPSSLSWQYTNTTSASWTSESFQVQGILLNGHTKWTDPDNWISLRYFMFGPDSFKDFQSQIEILDARYLVPGWADWIREHPEDFGKIYYRWQIDTRLQPVTVELLKPDNPYPNVVTP